MVLSVRFISLVNLIVDKSVVKELIQKDCSIDNIRNELEQLIPDTEYRNTMLQGYAEVSGRIGETGVSDRTADLIIEYMIAKTSVIQ